MINWYDILSNSFWIIGLAVALATVSWSLYPETENSGTWWQRLNSPAHIQSMAAGMALFMLGLGFRRGSPLWQSGLWFALFFSFALVGWQAHQRARGREITLKQFVQQRILRPHGMALGIILLSIFMASLYAVTIRPWMQPDEPRHYEVALHNVRLGKLGATDKDVNLDWEQEIIADMEAQSFWWYGYSLIGWDPEHLPQSFIEIWDPIYSRAFYQLPLYYNLAALVLYTWGQTLGHGQAVILLRFLGIFWLGVSLAGIYALGRLLFPQRPNIALWALTFAALWPAHLAANAAVNNDPMAEALVIWATFFALRLLRDGPNFKSLTWFFSLVILTIYTKRTGFSVLVLMLAIPGWGLLHLRRKATRRTRLLSAAMLAAGLAAIPLGFYLIKATGRYGLSAQNQANLSLTRLWELAQAAPLEKSALSLYKTFWGWYGWLRVPLPTGFYRVGILITVGMLVLLGLGYGQILKKKQPGWQRAGLVLLLLILFTQLGLTLGKDIVYQAWKAGSVPQMRYLYPVLPAIVLPMAAGLDRGLPKTWKRWILPLLVLLLIGFNLYTLGFVLYPFFWL